MFKMVVCVDGWLNEGVNVFVGGWAVRWVCV